MTSTAVRFALASLLVLAQLLVPFAHGPASATAAGWAEICIGGNGVRPVPTDGAPAAPLHDSDHCALCRIAGSLAGLAPSVPALIGRQAEHEEPGPVDACSVGRPPHHDAQARAPPPVA